MDSINIGHINVHILSHLNTSIGGVFLSYPKNLCMDIINVA